MIVDQPHLPLGQSELVGQHEDVSEDALRAEDFGVLEGHGLL